MAKANTFAMEGPRVGYVFSDDRPCAICGAKPEYRAFFYPTYMNGDAEFLGDFCKEHKGINLRDICKGKVPIRYKVDGAPNATVVEPPTPIKE